MGGWPKRSTGPIDYIVNHWRGDLSLAKSYWLNTFLLSLPFTIMLSSLESLAQAVRTMEQTTLFFWVFASLTVFAVPLTVWQLIGTWRSATKRTLNTGKSGWSSVAKVVMVIGWLQLSAGIVQIADDWPAYEEIASYTLGLNPIGDYTVTVIDGGSGVAVQGAIARGVVDEVRSALARVEEPFYVALDSEGGRIGVGDSLNRLIQERGLATLVEGKCYSACALAFLGGQSRIVGDGAMIGFHKARSGLDDSPTFRAMELSADELQRTIMREAGVREWFIDEALDTPSERMWRPSVEVLAEGDVITHTWTDGELRLAP
ncbi:hypothetical protein BA899_01255 [Spiribacter sp. SSL99]|uniref:COG3904 family protein n=1 Tax=Spiribacter sp. SSL99 TaxID=1866884 RepID=UPI00132FC40F|nr:hypothetical protein [Spiribacter sp. SSL99]KAF0285834.1 hypothetical protein BA899_01255 [Spiribacter sp. SSL99]